MTDLQSSVDLAIDDLRNAQERIRETLMYERIKGSTQLQDEFTLLQVTELIGNTIKELNKLMED